MNIEQFRVSMVDICIGMVDLLTRKRQTYGADNLTTDGRFGIMVRTSDKVHRLRHMYKGGTQAAADGESEADAWRDIAGYALLALYDIEQGKGKERIGGATLGEAHGTINIGADIEGIDESLARARDALFGLGGRFGTSSAPKESGNDVPSDTPDPEPRVEGVEHFLFHPHGYNPWEQYLRPVVFARTPSPKRPGQS